MLNLINLRSEWCSDVHINVNGFIKTCAKNCILQNKDNITAMTQVALGGGITSIGLTNLTKGSLNIKMPFFQSLLPSFCRTCSESYHYHFYWAYDYTDPYFKHESNLLDFKNVFVDEVSKYCSTNITVSLHQVRCNHFGKPAWAQNDAMMEAYIDNMEYFYR